MMNPKKMKRDIASCTTPRPTGHRARGTRTSAPEGHGMPHLRRSMRIFNAPAGRGGGAPVGVAARWRSRAHLHRRRSRSRWSTADTRRLHCTMSSTWP